MRLFRRRKLKKIKKYNTAKFTSNAIGVHSSYMPKRYGKLGYKWKDKFKNIKYLFLGR